MKIVHLFYPKNDDSYFFLGETVMLIMICIKYLITDTKRNDVNDDISRQVMSVIFFN